MAMIGALNIAQSLTFAPLLLCSRTNNRRFSVRSSSESDDSFFSSLNLTFAAPADFKPPKPKVLGVNPDKRGDIFGASLAIFFRLGTGIFSSGWRGFAFRVNGVVVSLTSTESLPKKSNPQKSLKHSTETPQKSMAGALSLAQAPILAPLSRRPSLRRRVLLSSIRASSDVSPSPSPPSALEFAPPPNFKAPEPRRFAARPDKVSDIVGASVATLLRLGTGVFVSGYSASLVPKDEFPPGQYALEFAGYKVKETAKLGPRPEKPIEIYEFESCPFCRKVREIVAVLDIDVFFYPCPKNGPNFRPKAIQLGGKKQFPYMVDPNTGVSMYESDDIIKYLVNKYGDGTVPLMLSLGLFTTITAGLALAGRAGKGSTYTPAKLPPKPLEIWAYEGSPFCKYVREVLVELELPHIQRSCARGSPKRQILYDKVGHFQVPYLQDPNTGIEMFESAEIADYLRATYAK